MIDGEVKLRFAKAYGFRSIQNLVSRLKQIKSTKFDYVEVMACPERVFFHFLFFEIFNNRFDFDP